VKRIPSPIPDKKWYLRPWVVALAGGLLPFGSIFIEMYFIFTSFWNYKVLPRGALLRGSVLVLLSLGGRGWMRGGGDRNRDAPPTCHL
jgi:transmembrane 9 superfamily protein 3